MYHCGGFFNRIKYETGRFVEDSISIVFDRKTGWLSNGAEITWGSGGIRQQYR